MMEFIDQMRAEGHAVESIVRVLREQGVKIAARTYRAWRRPRISARTVTDAQVVDAVREAAAAACHIYIGPNPAYKPAPQPPRTVARGMVAALRQQRPGVRVVESGELQELGNERA